jgi:hypothetical protein
VAEEQEGATEDSQEPNYQDKNEVALERPLHKVIPEANAAREDKQNAEDRDWPRSLHSWRAGLYARARKPSTGIGTAANSC